ncbi:hypothetical protein [Calycomorphotria hydatis]|uniref:VWFA domain-containing protein n=1 Tax=Calycomorphotria hydatis TaxID=2528027 RepID=A0A517TEH4_9PLAN|nr:hypothetical protein [Calycomorphotria hydatis]QDT66773.1 hypothetical protein V22_40440 [Calycomorphotria hydatis]
MTSLRFVGDLPLWAGITLAIAVAFLAFRYYRQDCLNLSVRLRWLLFALRSTVFLLTVLILTGPVLHHRAVVGRLGKVKIYFDGSNSMEMLDRHMPIGRKLLIAEQLEWISDGIVDRTLYDQGVDLEQIRRNYEAGKTSALEYRTQLESFLPEMPVMLRSRFQEELISPLVAIVAAGQESSDEVKKLINIHQQFEKEVSRLFEEGVAAQVASGDESLAAALALFDETPRWKRAGLAFTQTSTNVLQELLAHHEVELMCLNGEEAILQPIGLSSSGSTQFINFTDRAFPNLTDLSTGIIESQGGMTTTAEMGALQEQAAVVLVTDGQHNSGAAPVESAQVLAQQGITYYTVAIGTERQAPDLAVISVEYPQVVFQNDRVSGFILIRDQIEAGQPFVAQIEHDGEVLWRKQLLTTNASERKLEFEFKLDQTIEQLSKTVSTSVTQHAVPLKLSATLSPLAVEAETTNNSQPFRLSVISDSYQILLLDGRSRWETRYLRNIFERDEQWEIDTIIAGPGTDLPVLPRGDQPNQFPTSREALFEYDLIILGEVSSELMKPRELEWLSEFVEIRGGGLILIDGLRGKLRELSSLGLDSLMPVEWTSAEANVASHLALTSVGETVNELKLKQDQTVNRQFWTELPKPHRFVPTKPRPAAETLVEVIVNTDHFPALVTQRVGAGRVLYLAFDETWRWRYKTADQWHQLFWNQLATYVMPPPFAASDDYLSIESGPSSYLSGDSANIRIQLRDLDGKPATGMTADALLWKDGRLISTIGLTPDYNIPGIYRGQTDSLSPGEYEVSVRASGYSESALQARSQFHVRPDVTAELIWTSANTSLLKQMAATTGGQFLFEEELQSLPELLQPFSDGHVEESDTLLWQSYWWFASIILLLAAEWTIRKRAGLL